MSEPTGIVYQAVYDLYKNTAMYGNWRRKVDAMPPHQVWGIYYTRVVHAPKPAAYALSSLAVKTKANSIWHEPTEYHCTQCGAKYKRDNPDLKYCEYCNSKFEEENDYGIRNNEATEWRSDLR
jgi:hypothetical protein